MPKLLTTLKDWSPAAAAFCVVILAAVYAFSRQAEVAAEIREMDHLALTLTDTATDARRGTLSPEEIKEIQLQREDLETRMEDSRKPGIVVPQLSEAARSTGLLVLEIHPVKKRNRGQLRKGAPEYPHYEVLVQGSYQQIADYMQGCSKQRIPVRVIGFRIDRVEEASGLSAEIKVEAFKDISTEEKKT
ncbi:MAG: hypothetical protein MI923_14705 [Phycisphaerales bacterium]|nr:hypothetical protein [Phycisphaerales bacterium]